MVDPSITRANTRYVNFVSRRLTANMTEPERIIGKYQGSAKGPMMIVLGGIHGNEHAGVQAIEIVSRMLEIEPDINQDFEFHGTFLGLRGNLQALSRRVRFIDKDLNRSLTPGAVSQILQKSKETLHSEDREIHELISTIQNEIAAVEPRKIVVLDLHTTSASGGIFVLTSHEKESIRIGIEMHAPVITGFGDQVKGTTMEYFAREQFHRDIVTVVFESGRHDEPLSVNRAIAGIINCMRTIGCVPAAHVENRHDHLLQEYSRDLPKVAKLIDRYRVINGTDFEMMPDYTNFEPVRKGQILAYTNGHPVRAGKDGLLLMPRYQEQSDDGFFIIQPLEGY
jgi:succinylglutamate desuccinylase